MASAPSIPFVKLVYTIDNVTTEPNKYFYIDNTNIEKPFLAYDGDPVEDIYVRFTGTIPKLMERYSNIEQYKIYSITNYGLDITAVTGLFRENGSANIFYNHYNIKHNLGSLILYEHEGRRRVYVKINWSGTFFDQWKRIALFDEVQPTE
jgi:hypothetical protein